MKKSFIAAAAAAIALAPISVIIPVAIPVVHADDCPGPTPTPEKAACYCNQHPLTSGNQQCLDNVMQSMQQEMQLPCPGGKRRILDPPWCVGPDAVTTPARAPSTQAPSAPPPTAKAAVLPAPKGLDAPPDAVAAAKGAPATHVDPANPPKPPTQVEFNRRVQSVVTGNKANIDVVNGLAHPRHWDYIDYDDAQHPVLYNPINEATTFRYYYSGDYRELYVEAGSKVVLDTTVGGVYPFTAVSDNYLASGSFNGGGPTALYHDVDAYIPAYGKTVQVVAVTPVGHDDSQPASSQDTFMLDDSTLAWGKADNPTDGGQITVAKTQTLPGVGPTDDGKSLVDLTVASHPQSNSRPWLVGGLIAALLVAVGVLVIRARRLRRST